MAVPFYIPEQNDGGDASNITNNPNTTSSATQTPLPSPVNREHLVQAFYDALYRCSVNGSPDIIQNQQSCNTPLFVYDDRNLLQNNSHILNNNIANEEILQEYPFIQQNHSAARRSHIPICYDNIRCDSTMSRNELDQRFEFYMLEREKLEEFSGRLPTRKKRKEKLGSKFITTDNFLKWSTVVTVVVIAMGCGLLATR